MNSRALLTAILFGSAIAATRLVAQAPAPQSQKPDRQADTARCTAGPRMIGSVDGAASGGAAPLCSD